MMTAQNRAEPNQDVLAQLLVEIRGLRATMEQMGSAGPRVQLALGRIQLQEALNLSFPPVHRLRPRGWFSTAWTQK